MILLSPCSLSYRPIGTITEPVKRGYAYKHDIEIAFPIYHGAESDHGWGRIEFMRDYLTKTDWLLFMGADVVPVNHRIDPRSFIQHDVDIIAAWDANGLQSDVMLMRNCPAVESFLSEVINRREEDCNLPGLAGTDQGCFVRTLMNVPWYENAAPVTALQNYPGIRVGQAPKSFNQYLHDYRIGDAIFHACDMRMDDRVKWLTAFSKQVIV